MTLAASEFDTTRLLQQLIACPSITPEDAGALAVLESALHGLGFSCERLRFTEAGTAPVDNLFARIGVGAPHFCFAGHSDVVPPGSVEDWQHAPFAAEIAHGILYGRGATDMKGSVAAFVGACADFIREQGKPKGSVSLLITGDEEGPAINGTVKVLHWMKEHGHIPDHCLVGEPSCREKLGDTIKVGRRGSLSFEITVEGRQGHVAYPDKTDNPIPKLARLIDRLSHITLDQGNDYFDPSNLSVTSFDVGNSASNVVPARAHAKLNIRFNSEHDYQSLKNWLDGQVSSVKQEMGGSWTITSSEGAEAFITKPSPFTDLVQQAITQQTGLVPDLSTTGGTSDARFIKDYCPVLEFGPTNASIHQVDEHLALIELAGTQAIYHRILNAYFRASDDQVGTTSEHYYARESEKMRQNKELEQRPEFS